MTTPEQVVAMVTIGAVMALVGRYMTRDLKWCEPCKAVTAHARGRCKKCPKERRSGA